MDIEAVDSIDAHCEILQRVLLDFARRSGQNSHIHLTEVLDIGHHLIFGQFLGDFSYSTAYNACNLKIGSSLQGLHCKAADIAISDHCSSDFRHSSKILMRKVNIFFALIASIRLNFIPKKIPAADATGIFYQCSMIYLQL